MISALGMAANSCIEEYWPDIEQYENILVVEGMITTSPPPYLVKLSQTSPVETPNDIPYKKCNVWISDDLGNTEIMTEAEPGMYYSSPEGMQGTVGRSYKIHIEAPDGRKYESEFETLPAPVNIESVDPVIETKEDPASFHDQAGYQFYITSHLAEYDSCYFWWQLIETYEYNADFTINFTYQGYISEFENPDTLLTCWKTETVPEIFIASSEYLQEPMVVDFPLQYVNTETRRLSVRYSLLVNQLMITKKAYHFLDNIKTLISEESSLYTQQPFQIRGNVNNISDPDEPVLGYFYVAGNDRKRIFLDRPVEIPFYYYECIPEFDLRGLFFAPRARWPIYITEIDGRMALGNEVCFDCTRRGGVLEKPDFW